MTLMSEFYTLLDGLFASAEVAKSKQNGEIACMCRCSGGLQREKIRGEKSCLNEIGFAVALPRFMTRSAEDARLVLSLVVGAHCTAFN